MHLGKYDDRHSAGSLHLFSETPGLNLSTPAMLSPAVADVSEVEVIRVSDVIRQVKTPFLLADVVTIGTSEYEIRYSQASQVGSLSSGVYTLTGSPYRVVNVLSPSSDANKLRVTDIQGGESRITLYVYDTTDKSWEMAEGLSPSAPTDTTTALRREVVKKVWNTGFTERTETRTLKNGNGTVVSKVVKKFKPFPWGEELIEQTDDPDSVAWRKTWQFNETGTDGKGQLKLFKDHNGYWERYTYVGNLLHEVVTPLNNNAYSDDLTALKTNNVVSTRTRSSLALDGDSVANDLVVKVVKSVQGSADSVSYNVTWSDMVSESSVNCYDVWDIECSTTTPTSGYSTETAFLLAVKAGTNTSHRVTKTRKYAAGTAHEFELRCVIAPDGTMTLYDYGSGSTTVQSGFPNSGFTEVIWGDKTESVVDSRGNPAHTKRWSREGSGGSWFTISLMRASQTDSFGRPTETEYFFGAAANSPNTSTPAYTTSTAYGCCGIESTTDRAGLATAYTYDALRRTKTVTRASGTSGRITEIYSYDGAGQTISTTRQGYDGTSSPPQIVTQTTSYDALGRVIASGDALSKKTFMRYRFIKPDGTAFTVGTDTGAYYQEGRTYPHDNTSGPITVVWTDGHGHTARTWTGSTTSTWNTTTGPSGTETLTQLSRSTNDYDGDGRVVTAREYFNLASLGLSSAGTVGTNFYQSSFIYDTFGQHIRATDGIGNITATVYEAGGRSLETWRGTVATGATPSDPSAGGGSNNMVRVSRNYYNSGYNSDPANRPFVTRTEMIKPQQSVAYTTVDFDVSTDTSNEFRIQWTKPAVGPWTKQVSDYEGSPLESMTYQNGSTSYVVAKTSKTYTSGSKRLSASRTYEANTSGGLTGSYLESVYSYDDAGRQAKVTRPSGGFSKTLYDPFGRTARTAGCSTEGSDTTATTLTGDTVLSESVPTYDDVDNVIQITSYARNHDASATGALSSSSTSARISYAATWYDNANRPTHNVDYGTNGGSSFTRPSSAPEPNTSDNYIVSKSIYDSAGRVKDMVDNKALVTRREYDDLGRVKKLTENYVDGTPGNDNDRITLYTYNAEGQIVTQTADMPSGTDDQITTYVYAASLTDKGCPVKANSYLRAVVYPDADDVVSSSALANGSDSTYDRVELTYQADGSLATQKDQRAVVLTFTYDDAARRTAQAVTSGTVSGDKQIKYTYNDRGQSEKITSYSVVDTTISNEVKLAYNGFGQLTTEYQDHDSAVDTTTGTGSPRLGYAYDTTVSSNVFTKGSRLNKTTYPNGRILWRGYDGHSGIDDAVSRPSKLAEDSSGSLGTAVASYNFLGNGVSVRTDYATPQVRLDRWGGTTGTYSGLDRFGRVVSNKWKSFAGADVFAIDHAYDRASNRVSAANSSHKNASHAYTYDNLNRLTEDKKGLINTSSNTIESYWVSGLDNWSLDALGNQVSADSSQYTATFNKANEIVTRSVKARGLPIALDAADEFSSDTSARWELPSGSSDTFTIHTGTAGHFKFGTIAADTYGGNTESDARSIVLYGAPVGGTSFATSLTFPSGTTSGQCGVVFGYKSANDYWLRVFDMDQNVKIYHVVNGAKTLVNSWATTVTAGTALNASNGNNNFNVGWPFSTSLTDGYPSGRVGLYSTVANVLVDRFEVKDYTPAKDLGGRWWAAFWEFTSAGGLNLSIDNIDGLGPVILQNKRYGGYYNVTFALKRQSGTSASFVRLLLNLQDSEHYDELTIFHYDTPQVPILYRVSGTTSTYLAHGTNSMPALTSSDVLWTNIQVAGTQIEVKCLVRSVGAASPEQNDWDGATTRLSASISSPGGLIGFLNPYGWYVSTVDDFKVQGWQENNADWDEPNALELFTNDSSGYVQETLTYDKAGNLTYDGQFLYDYDAWNRQVKATQEARNGSGAFLGSNDVVSTTQYDGRGRRIVKAVVGGGNLDCTYHYYYDGDSLVETRNGSNQTVQQQVWGLNYIDELVQSSVNTDFTSNSSCETSFWACPDANFNVLGIVDSSGAVKERYEYSAYGQRQVFYNPGSNDTGAHGPTINSQRVYALGQNQPWGLCAFGHQGLMHDDESGNVYNRTRILSIRLGRFFQRDSLAIGFEDQAAQKIRRIISSSTGAMNGYEDGLSLYQIERSNPVRWSDAMGLQATQPSSQPTACCGPRVDEQLLKIHNDFRAKFLSVPKGVAMLQFLNQLTDLGKAGNAWDIAELRLGSASNAECKSGIGGCKGTVTVNDQCWSQGVVNYWIAGSVISLRDDIDKLENANAIEKGFMKQAIDNFILAMAAYVKVKDVMGGNASGQSEAEEKKAWMEAGLAGNLNSGLVNALVKKNPFNNCAPCKSAARRLSWHVGDNGNFDISGIAE